LKESVLQPRFSPYTEKQEIAMIPVEYSVTEDPIEAMSLLAAAIVTKSQITIERVPIDFLDLELFKLEKMGFKYKILKKV
jgi:UDP-N-acetylglucosamine 1-carboxyvinyltransferase